MAAPHIIIGGGSGFIGRALTAALRGRGDRVTWISPTSSVDRITWADAARTGLPPCDAAVNLAGQHILDLQRRWSDACRDEVVRPRVETMRTLVRALDAMPVPPEAFVSTAGRCFYGTAELAAADDHPELDESSTPMGLNFPAELVGLWEAAAEEVDASRPRHVQPRIGVVLGTVKRGGLLGRLWLVGRSRRFLPLARLPSAWASARPLAQGGRWFRGGTWTTWRASCSSSSIGPRRVAATMQRRPAAWTTRPSPGPSPGPWGDR